MYLPAYLRRESRPFPLQEDHSTDEKKPQRGMAKTCGLEQAPPQPQTFGYPDNEYGGNQVVRSDAVDKTQSRWTHEVIANHEAGKSQRKYCYAEETCKYDGTPVNRAAQENLGDRFRIDQYQCSA